jgi:4-carboxymuconolactone decarboxylase
MDGELFGLLKEGVRFTLRFMAALSSRRSASKVPLAVKREFARLAVQLAKHDSAGRDSRRARGLQQLTETVGREGAQVLTKLVAFSPELTRLVVDFAYGEVIGRKQLDARTRALVVVAALAALGNAQPQLQVHIGSALNSGCTREEILEVLLVVAVYAGFPAAMNGMTAARAAMEASETRTAKHGTPRKTRTRGPKRRGK